MTTVIPYLLAVLLVPVGLALMLFVVARIEGELPSGRQSGIPRVP
jgi:uncharacterized membrane protein YdfJ with MMPL/SSD domain